MLPCREEKTDLKTASAIGDRQMFPKQTNKTDIGLDLSVIFDDGLMLLLFAIS